MDLYQSAEKMVTHLPSRITAARRRFAVNAKDLLVGVISDVSNQSEKASTDINIFGKLASARLRAPVEMVKYLAAHPLVASVGLISDN